MSKGRCERVSGKQRCAEPAQWTTDSGHHYCSEHTSQALREDPVPDTEPAPALYDVCKAVTQ